MKTVTIERKNETINSHSIHSLEGEYDRIIKFPKNHKYAVVLAAFYGGYTTHKTQSATIKKSNAMADYSHAIIDEYGNQYSNYNGSLMVD